jgi:glycopeptide antibiotics resistance protein
MAPVWLENLSRGIVPFRLTFFHPFLFVLSLIPLPFLWWRGKRAGYLLCFSLFFVYTWSVVAITITYLLPMNETALQGIRGSNWSAFINLVPTVLTGEFDPTSEQVYGNFLMGVPFGFGFPFVASARYSAPRRAVAAGFALGAGLELAQLLIGLVILRGPYRTIDIDDVWLVFAGTLAGYGVLWAAARLYQRIGWAAGARVPVWDHIHTVLLNVASGGPALRGDRARTDP